MPRSHHQYRPLLSRSCYLELVRDDGTPDHDAIADYYNKYLAQHQNNPTETLTGIAWVVTEMIWHQEGCETVRISPEEAFDLMVMTVDFDNTRPEFAPAEKTVCYEFPAGPPIPLGGNPVTAFLLTPGETCNLVLQGDQDRVCGKTLSMEELIASANELFQIPDKLEKMSRKNRLRFNAKRMGLLLYHMATGPNGRATWKNAHTRTRADGVVEWF